MNSVKLNEAASKIQRLFRKRLASDDCIISGRTFMATYEIVLDKQVYDARELYKNLHYSTQVPHSRRELTDDEITQIRQKFNPFDIEGVYNCNRDQNKASHLTALNDTSPKYSMRLTSVVNKNLLNNGFEMLS